MYKPLMFCLITCFSSQKYEKEKELFLLFDFFVRSHICIWRYPFQLQDQRSCCILIISQVSVYVCSVSAFAMAKLLSAQVMLVE